MNEFKKNKFQSISTWVDQEVNMIKCSKTDFVEGIDMIISDLQIMRDAAQEEIDFEEKNKS